MNYNDTNAILTNNNIDKISSHAEKKEVDETLVKHQLPSSILEDATNSSSVASMDSLDIGADDVDMFMKITLMI